MTSIETSAEDRPALKADGRDAKGGWAPGSYLNRCSGCDATFMGDKRASSCADCAYDGAPIRELTHAQIVVVDNARSVLVDIVGANVRGVPHPNERFMPMLGFMLIRLTPTTTRDRSAP